MVQKEIIRKSRILIVDDEPTNVLLLERILQQDGYTNFNKTRQADWGRLDGPGS